jgi:tRNA pseudouridine38-40 synthase
MLHSGNFAYLTRFHDFFHHVDHYRTEYFLWVTASGISAAKQTKAKNEDGSEDEADPDDQEG